MGYETVQFDKRSRVEQKVDPFTGSQFTVSMLFIDSFLTSAQYRFLSSFFELLSNRIDGSHK